MNKLTTDQLQSLTEEMNEYLAETGKQRFPADKAEELAALGTKRCSKCTSVKLIEEFGKNSRNRDGLQGHCRQCHYAGIADYSKRNPDKVRESKRKYEQNRGCRREYRRAYYEQHREQLNEYRRTRYRTNEHSRLGEQLTRGYHRAVEAGNEAEWITPDQLLTWWQAKGIDPLRCYLTGAELTPFDRSVDHVLAISNGGTHTVDNLLPCTFEANMKKKTLDPDEAKELLSND